MAGETINSTSISFWEKMGKVSEALKTDDALLQRYVADPPKVLAEFGADTQITVRGETVSLCEYLSSMDSASAVKLVESLGTQAQKVPGIGTQALVGIPINFLDTVNAWRNLNFIQYENVAHEVNIIAGYSCEPGWVPETGVEGGHCKAHGWTAQEVLDALMGNGGDDDASTGGAGSGGSDSVGTGAGGGITGGNGGDDGSSGGSAGTGGAGSGGSDSVGTGAGGAITGGNGGTDGGSGGDDGGSGSGENDNQIQDNGGSGSGSHSGGSIPGSAPGGGNINPGTGSGSSHSGGSIPGSAPGGSNINPGTGSSGSHSGGSIPGSAPGGSNINPGMGGSSSHSGGSIPSSAPGGNNINPGTGSGSSHSGGSIPGSAPGGSNINPGIGGGTAGTAGFDIGNKASGVSIPGKGGAGFDIGGKASGVSIPGKGGAGFDVGGKASGVNIPGRASGTVDAGQTGVPGKNTGRGGVSSGLANDLNEIKSGSTVSNGGKHAKLPKLPGRGVWIAVAGVAAAAVIAGGIWIGVGRNGSKTPVEEKPATVETVAQPVAEKPAVTEPIVTEPAVTEPVIEEKPQSVLIESVTLDVPAVNAKGVAVQTDAGADAVYASAEEGTAVGAHSWSKGDGESLPETGWEKVCDAPVRLHVSVSAQEGYAFAPDVQVQVSGEYQQVDVKRVSDTELEVTVSYAFEHLFEQTSTKHGTCVERDKIIYTCANCGEKKTENGGYGDHQWREWVGHAGQHDRTCKLCGEREWAECVDGKYEYESGLMHRVYCKVCGGYLRSESHTFKGDNVCTRCHSEIVN